MVKACAADAASVSAASKMARRVAWLIVTTIPLWSGRFLYHRSPGPAVLFLQHSKKFGFGSPDGATRLRSLPELRRVAPCGLRAAYLLHSPPMAPRTFFPTSPLVGRCAPQRPPVAVTPGLTPGPL